MTPKSITIPFHLYQRFIDPIIQTERKRLRFNLRRAIKAGTPATLTLPQWLAILHAYNWQCAFCRQPYESMEHLRPISHGGGTTPHNCVPACHTCNDRNNTVHQQLTQQRHRLQRLAPSPSQGEGWGEGKPQSPPPNP